MDANRNPNHDADVIVIGSGMGGLATAALLARLHGRKVLVLERHYRAGGFTHTFTRRGGFAWDVGVHYVGEMGAAGDAAGRDAGRHRRRDPLDVDARDVRPARLPRFRVRHPRREEELPRRPRRRLPCRARLHRPLLPGRGPGRLLDERHRNALRCSGAGGRPRERAARRPRAGCPRHHPFLARHARPRRAPQGRARGPLGGLRAAALAERFSRARRHHLSLLRGRVLPGGHLGPDRRGSDAGHRVRGRLGPGSRRGRADPRRGRSRHRRPARRRGGAPRTGGGVRCRRTGHVPEAPAGGRPACRSGTSFGPSLAACPTSRSTSGSPARRPRWEFGGRTSGSTTSWITTRCGSVAAICSRAVRRRPTSPSLR